MARHGVATVADSAQGGEVADHVDMPDLSKGGRALGSRRPTILRLQIRRRCALEGRILFPEMAESHLLVDVALLPVWGCDAPQDPAIATPSGPALTVPLKRRNATSDPLTRTRAPRNRLIRVMEPRAAAAKIVGE